MFMLIRLSILYSHVSTGKYFFVGSLGMILVITGVAVFLYTKDIFILQQIDHSGSVAVTQRKVAALHCSILNSVRISWLQLPFYTTWYLNEGMLAHGSFLLWIFQFLATVSATWLAIWLFRNINSANINNKWVRNFMRGNGFSSVIQAREFLNETDTFSREEVSI